MGKEYRCKKCKSMNSGDGSKCHNLCLHCTNLALTQYLNDIKEKKRKQYIPNIEKKNLLLRKKIAKITGYKARDIEEECSSSSLSKEDENLLNESDESEESSKSNHEKDEDYIPPKSTQSENDELSIEIVPSSVTTSGRTALTKRKSLSVETVRRNLFKSPDKSPNPKKQRLQSNSKKTSKNMLASTSRLHSKSKMSSKKLLPPTSSPEEQGGYLHQEKDTYDAFASKDMQKTVPKRKINFDKHYKGDKHYFLNMPFNNRLEKCEDLDNQDKAILLKQIKNLQKDIQNMLEIYFKCPKNILIEEDSKGVITPVFVCPELGCNKRDKNFVRHLMSQKHNWNEEDANLQRFFSRRYFSFFTTVNRYFVTKLSICMKCFLFLKGIDDHLKRVHKIIGNENNRLSVEYR